MHIPKLNNTYEIHVINLKKSYFKFIDMEKEFSKYPRLKLKRFEAVTNEIGWKGCTMSHLSLVKMAKDNKLPYIIVMEDDCSIIDYIRFIEILDYLTTSVQQCDWDLFNGNPTFMFEREQELLPYSSSPVLINYMYGLTTNLIIYNKSSYSDVLEIENIYKIMPNNAIPHNYAIDKMLSKLQLKKLCPIPFVSTQIPTFSDLNNEFANYSHIFNVTEQWLLERVKKMNCFVSDSGSNTKNAFNYLTEIHRHVINHITKNNRLFFSYGPTTDQFELLKTQDDTITYICPTLTITTAELLSKIKKNNATKNLLINIDRLNCNGVDLQNSGKIKTKTRRNCLCIITSNKTITRSLWIINTWLKFLSKEWKILFVSGKCKENEPFLNKIEEFNNEHETDIELMQLACDDTYFGLPNKIANLMSELISKPSHYYFNYMVKIDDDSVVKPSDFNNLIFYLNSMASRKFNPSELYKYHYLGGKIVGLGNPINFNHRIKDPNLSLRKCAEERMERYDESLSTKLIEQNINYVGEWYSGGLYILSRALINQVVKSDNFIETSKTQLYEDKFVGDTIRIVCEGKLPWKIPQQASFLYKKISFVQIQNIDEIEYPNYSLISENHTEKQFKNTFSIITKNI